tara:strand:- start:907 stop:2352 length:1446 start_codon:yes stop_codon:yes gene_type:complete
VINVKNYINGQFLESISKNKIDNINPATGKIISTFPRSTKNDIDKAVDVAKNSFQKWKNLPIAQRASYLIKLGNEIKKNAKALAAAETADTGKPLHLSKKMDIPRSSENFIYFGNAIIHNASEFHKMDNNSFNYTLRQPVGVVGCIAPWNLPLYLLTWKIAPALATGNTVVAKPSELTPHTAYLLSKICNKINLPKGVLNIIYGLGSEAGEALVLHKDVPIITFTGGTETGKKIMKNSARNLKKISLELGGKNPNIIFDDADINLAVEISIKSSFLNQGQICLCGSRIFVQKKIYKEFKSKFLLKVKKLIVGDPENINTDLGALISKDHFNKVMGFIEKAKQEGASIIQGGNSLTNVGKFKNGFFIEPTVIENADINSDINQKEIFGPIVSLNYFDSEEDVINFANNTNYGLSASIYTQNLNRAHRVANLIEAGTIWINTWLLRDLRVPFGGMKHSGIGREGGIDSLHFFTESKNVCVKYE